VRTFSTRRGDDGFTLIELLVVVVIIGVLVAIAVPVYLNYRQGAADKSAQSDVRGAVSAVEQFYTDNNNTYPDSIQGANDGSGTTWLTLTASALSSPRTQVVTLSDETQLGFVNSGGSYLLCGNNTGGSDKWYVYNSATGGSVAASGATTVDLATCS